MLVILYINAFVAAYCNSLVNVALVDIMQSYQISATSAQWLVSGYTIVTVIMVMSMAFVYRRFTTQQIFYAAQVLFVVSGLGCLLAPNYAVLLLARLVQGVATGLSTPLMMNAVMVLAPPEHRGFAMGVGSTIITLGPAFAPVLSGVMTTAFGWHTIFLPPVAVTVCLCIAGKFTLRNLNESSQAVFDAPSAVILALALTLVSFGLTRVVTAPVTAIVLLAVGALVLVLFARRQNRIPSPFLVLSPLRLLRFWPCCLMTLAAIMTTFSVNLLVPLYLEEGLGFTALDAGQLMLIMVIFNTATGLVAGLLLDRWGAWPLIPLGFACIIAGQVAILVAGQAYEVVAIVIGGCFVCAGVGLTSSPSQVTGLSSLEPDLYPHGVSIVSAFIQIAGCLAPTLYVGVMNGMQDAALAGGAHMQTAVAQGMGAGMAVALGISFAALTLSLIYTLVIQRKR